MVDEISPLIKLTVVVWGVSIWAVDIFGVTSVGELWFRLVGGVE